MAYDCVGEEAMNYTQSQKDLVLPAKLRAADWRLVCYALEHMIDFRRSLGHDEVAHNYDVVREKLSKELDVESSGNLPVDR